MPKETETYPEHEKLKAEEDRRAAVQEFLDWLDESPEEHPQVVLNDNHQEIARYPKRWALGHYPTITHDSSCELMEEGDWHQGPDLDEIRLNKAQIIGLFLGVDPDKLEAEKQQMLTALRDTHEGENPCPTPRTPDASCPSPTATAGAAAPDVCNRAHRSDGVLHLRHPGRQHPADAGRSAARMRALTYPFRRLWWFLVDSNLPCRHRYCARPQVGLSIYCRQHTDEILKPKETP
jgi:hypothetical protein